jgi:hypothetical protein
MRFSKRNRKRDALKDSDRQEISLVKVGPALVLPFSLATISWYRPFGRLAVFVSIKDCYWPDPPKTVFLNKLAEFVNWRSPWQIALYSEKTALR